MCLTIRVTKGLLVTMERMVFVDLLDNLESQESEELLDQWGTRWSPKLATVIHSLKVKYDVFPNHRVHLVPMVHRDLMEKLVLLDPLDQLETRGLGVRPESQDLLDPRENRDQKEQMGRMVTLGQQENRDFQSVSIH